jgi:hypothetical protein
MGKHQSSVNFENLIKDLADMYPFDVGTVVLVELVANSLDSKATLINISYDDQAKSLVVTDNGTGMTHEEFDQYHDFAAGLKTRGMGIGFAGVGAKISFNIAPRVITETRSQSYAGGSNWYLESRKSLAWDDISPSHLESYGTRVNVIFRKDASLTFDDTDGIIALLRQHYLPLLDTHFLSLYSELGYYDANLRFVVDGKYVEPTDIVSDYHLDSIHRFYPTSGNKRLGYGVFGLSSKEYPMGESLCGVLLCTHGKVIKPDLFNQFPGDIGARIMGLVEIPDFVHFLTSSKTDFVRRKRLREFEKLYNPIRQEFRDWLKGLGVEPPETTSRDEAARLEREIRKLVDDIPELGEFFGFRIPKQVLQNQASGETLADAQQGAEVTFPIGEGQSHGGEGPLDVGEGPGEALVEDAEKGSIRAKPISRTGRRGPKVAFSESPDRVDLAWVDGNNIVINSGHPAYRKVISNTTANRLHCMHAVANAVQRFLFNGQPEDLIFTDRMMSAWGKK